MTPTHEELLDKARELEAFAKSVALQLEEFIKARTQEADDVDGSTPISK